MKTTKSIVVLCTILFVHAVKAQNNKLKIYLEGGLSNGIQSNAFASGVYGALGAFLTEHHSVDVRAREVYNFNNQDVVGAITFHYRYNFSKGLYLGGGFAHHHEVGYPTYVTNTGEAIMGSHGSILHRSGVGLELGYNFKPFYKKGFFSWIYPAFNITYTHMFMDNGENPLITANLGLRIGLKKMKEE
jgi:hypothetical protein